MRTHRFTLALLLSVGFSAGCDDPEGFDGEPGDISLRPGTGSQGGVWLNTSSIGTQPFSEIDLSGLVHDNLRFTGLLLARPGGVWLAATPEVTDGNLKGKVGKTAYVGADLIGSRWQLNLVDGGVETPVELVLTSYTQISPKEARYAFETLDENGVMTNICTPDASGSQRAIPMRDLTIDGATGDIAPRPKTLYLACTSGAVGKAIDMGYGPWVRSPDELEVAIRMVRADYCFDGMSWTTTGTAVQVKDKWATNNFLNATSANEVVWTKTGAACLTQPRSLTYSAPQVTCNGQPLPTCPANTGLTTYVDTLYWTKVGSTQ